MGNSLFPPKTNLIKITIYFLKYTQKLGVATLNNMLTYIMSINYMMSCNHANYYIITQFYCFTIL